MPPSPSPRRRGAQPGNSNALKHGFYTRRFKKNDLNGVEETSIKGLTEEIALIRIFTRRLVESCAQSADMYDLAGILRAICLASTSITRIIKAQSFLASYTSDFSRDVEEAIRQVRVELGIDPPPPSTDENV